MATVASPHPTVPDALFIREHEVRALLTMADCMQAVEVAFRDLAVGEAENPPRVRVQTPNGMLHVLPASVPAAGGAGVKAYPGFFGRGQGHVLLLFGTDDGQLRAVIQADWLGRLRTGAASGVATRALAREDAHILALFGTGRQAETQALGIAAARSLEEIRVYGRDRDRLRVFCELLASRIDARITAAAHPRDAVDGADLIATATRSGEPLFDGRWLAPGVHINATGSNVADHRELDDETIRGCSIIAVDSPEQATQEAGTLLLARASGALDWQQIRPIAEILAGRAGGRTSPKERTVFVSLGMGVEDVAAGMLVYERARQAGAGQRLLISPAE